MQHLSISLLEEYSLRALAESSLAAVEEHLLVCDRCRRRLERIEPVNDIHYTDDGPVYARATRLRSGEVMARHWGTDLQGGRAFWSISAAKRYLTESFSQMFPEHSCDDLCVPLAKTRPPETMPNEGQPRTVGMISMAWPH